MQVFVPRALTLVVLGFMIGCGGDPDTIGGLAAGPSTGTEQREASSPEAVPEVEVAAREVPVSEPPPVNAGTRTAASGPHTALAEYKRAFENRDMSRLSAIWAINPIERALVERAWENCEHISLTYRVGKVRAEASKASIDFLQTLRFRCPTEGDSSESRLRATLVRSGAGDWTISSIADRDSPAPAPRRNRTAASSAAATRIPLSATGREKAALTALNQYSAALRTCDLPALSRVWIMNPLERQILKGVCFQNRQLAVSITESRVFDSDEQLRVDFTQDLAYQGSRGARQTRSELTALLVQRGDGAWTIWKIRASN